jgi:pimeloyl-ACP methyl ester carboxylesterase
VDLPLILPPGGAPARELFLVLPGLNLHPGRLSPWHGLLAGQGSAVLAPRLTGYGFPGDPEQKKVTAGRYLDDLNTAWAEAGEQMPGAACSLLGFSLGGLLGLAWAFQQRIPLKRAVLISPALRLKAWVRIPITGLGRILPHRLGLPSLAPADYRLHPTTTVGAFWAVVELERQLSGVLDGWLGGGIAGSGGNEKNGGNDGSGGNETNWGREPPPHLLIAFAEKDEFIDTRVFHRLRKAFPERVSLHRLNHAARAGYPLHLGLDADTLGQGEWNRLKAAVKAWLAGTGTGENEDGRPGREATPADPLDPFNEKAP